jgi:hypothetical protein
MLTVLIRLSVFFLVSYENSSISDGNCMTNQLSCSNQNCVSRSAHCNGFNECGDNSDETQNCTCNKGICSYIINSTAL